MQSRYGASSGYSFPVQRRVASVLHLDLHLHLHSLIRRSWPTPVLTVPSATDCLFFIVFFTATATAAAARYHRQQDGQDGNGKDKDKDEDDRLVVGGAFFDLTSQCLTPLVGGPCRGGSSAVTVVKARRAGDSSSSASSQVGAVGVMLGFVLVVRAGTDAFAFGIVESPFLPGGDCRESDRLFFYASEGV